jgi:hypothetical protein
MKQIYVYWAEVSPINKSDFVSPTLAPFVDKKSAREFLQRNEEKYKHLRRRVCFRDMKGNFCFAEYLGVYYNVGEW